MHTNYRLPSLSGFCHFDLVLFMVLSPDTPVMSCFYVSARLWVCLLSVCLVSCWSVVFGSRHLCFEFRFRIEVRTLAVSRSMFCLVVWACGLEFAQPCALLSKCFVVLYAVRVFIGCVHSCYILCCVALAAGVFHWLRAFMLSCLVWTWLMSILISCVFVSCFAHGWWFVLLAMCLCFCFVWAHGFCLNFLCAMCSHVNCLDPNQFVNLLLINLPHLCLSRFPSHLLPL